MLARLLPCIHIYKDMRYVIYAFLQQVVFQTRLPTWHTLQYHRFFMTLFEINNLYVMCYVMCNLIKWISCGEAVQLNRDELVIATGFIDYLPTTRRNQSINCHNKTGQQIKIVITCSMMIFNWAKDKTSLNCLYQRR